MNIIRCPKCRSGELHSAMIDGRSGYSCMDCGNIFERKKAGRPKGSKRNPEGRNMLTKRGLWMCVHPTGDEAKVLTQGTKERCEAWLKQWHYWELYQEGLYAISVWKPLTRRNVKKGANAQILDIETDFRKD